MVFHVESSRTARELAIDLVTGPDPERVRDRLGDRHLPLAGDFSIALTLAYGPAPRPLTRRSLFKNTAISFAACTSPRFSAPAIPRS